jgi:GT2 family glycosyltransferase
VTADLLGIIVVNYGSSRLLERNLAAVRTDGRPVRIVVVDNFSSLEERAATADLAAVHGWALVTLPDNRGFGAGVNAGIRAARDAGCTCFLLLNPDASVADDVVAELRRHVLDDPAALVSPRILAPDGHVFFDGARLFLGSGRIRSRGSAAPAAGPAVEWVSGACLAVHEDLLERVGEFDESYFLYWEDVEFSHRARTAGASLVVRRDLTALHDAGGTQGPTRGRAKSALYYRYNCANRLRFAAQHLPRAQVVRWILATPAVGWEVLLRGGRRQLLTQPGLFLAAVRGSAAGLRVAAAALVRRPPRPAVERSGRSAGELAGQVTRSRWR